ncbi:MAG TPA: YetF domain-containing protein [Pyrinomonadaceae bacterium]|nr:YetF domain-containing protein [Pyrinomonadaceae bacterium]
MSGLLWDGTLQNLLSAPALPLAEKVLRPVIVYAALVVLLRVFGKRELAQLNPFDLVVLLSLSNTVQNAIIGDDNSLAGGLVGAVALLLVNYTVVRFMFRHRRLDQLVEGTPTKLIENGKLCQDGLARELLTPSELLTVAHRQGFRHLADIKTCVLEPGGGFYIEGHTPPRDERRHEELLARIDQLCRQMEELKRSVKK